MQVITNDIVVEMNYILKDDKDKLIDSTQPGKPLAYIQGHNNLVYGLEKEMDGKKVGDKFTVNIIPEEGYGKYDREMIFSYPKEHFGEDSSNLELGMSFQVGDDNGQTLILNIVEIKENEVILDGNHPLAGINLIFDIEVVNIRQASEEELKLGFIKPKGTCSTGCC